MAYRSRLIEPPKPSRFTRRAVRGCDDTVIGTIWSYANESHTYDVFTLGDDFDHRNYRIDNGAWRSSKHPVHLMIEGYFNLV